MSGGAVVGVDADAAGAPFPADLSDAEEEERAAAPPLELSLSEDSAAGSGAGCWWRFRVERKGRKSEALRISPISSINLSHLLSSFYLCSSRSRGPVLAHGLEKLAKGAGHVSKCDEKKTERKKSAVLSSFPFSDLSVCEKREKREREEEKTIAPTLQSILSLSFSLFSPVLVLPPPARRRRRGDAL